MFLYSMLRSSASGLEISLPGRILAGLLPGKHRNRPSGRPKAGWRADVGAFPVAVRPKSGPEGLFPARKHYCVTTRGLRDGGRLTPGSVAHTPGPACGVGIGICTLVGIDEGDIAI